MFIPYKSGEIEEEVTGAKKAVHVLGGKIEDVVKFQLPGTEIGRSFVKIKNIKTHQKISEKSRITCKGANSIKISISS